MAGTNLMDNTDGPWRQRLLGTWPQWLFLGLQLGLLVGLALYQISVHYDDARLLWTHPAGIMLTTTAAVFLVLDVGAYGLGCLVVNLAGPPERRGAVHWFGWALIALSCTLVLYLPVVKILLGGPDIVRATDNSSPSE